jgi:hypothetical protein
MASITATTDAANYRIGVQLGSWSSSGTVPVYRVHPDGSRYAVRAMSDVSGGAAFGWDYEAPLSTAVHYEADNSGSTVTSNTVTLTVSARALLTAPGLPAYGGPVVVAARAEPARSRPAEAISILGRSTDIVKSDVLKAPKFNLALLTRSDSEANDLTAMVAITPVLLLRIPGTRVTDWCYVQVGELAETPVSRVLPQPVPATGDERTWAGWRLACQVVDAPVGGIVGDPTSTWQALKDTGKTWQQVKDSGKTWLQILKGEF